MTRIGVRTTHRSSSTRPLINGAVPGRRPGRAGFRRYRAVVRCAPPKRRFAAEARIAAEGTRREGLKTPDIQGSVLGATRKWVCVLPALCLACRRAAEITQLRGPTEQILCGGGISAIHRAARSDSYYGSLRLAFGKFVNSTALERPGIPHSGIFFFFSRAFFNRSSRSS